MTCYFLSDVHLYPQGKHHPGRKPFLLFLEQLTEKEPGELWILGDLFDYWFEYAKLIPGGYGDVLCRLRTLSEGGWKTFFIPGNHDWWCGEQLEQSSGMKILRNAPVRTTIQGLECLMAHGDGLGNGDQGYRMMKPFLRSTAVIGLFKLLHPALATALANSFSGTSKRILRKTADTVPGFLSEWAEARGAEGIDLVITGHTHCPELQKFPGVVHASLGDWISHFTYLTIREGEIDLNEFKQ